MLRRIIAPMVEFGPLAGTLYILDRVLSRLSPRLRILAYELVVQPIPSTPVLPSARVRTLRCKELKRGDPDLRKVIAPLTVQEFRFAQDSICLATYREDRLIGYVWFCSGSYNEDEARCKFLVNPPGKAVFDFDLVVLPEFRMGLGFAAVWHCTAQYLRDRQIEYSFSRITRFNSISRRSHSRLGSIRIGSMLVVKVWGLEIFVATLPPFIRICLPASRVMVPLRLPAGVPSNVREPPARHAMDD